MKITLKEIDLSKRDGCHHNDIMFSPHYLVKYNGHYIIGKFTYQWYGWNFDWFGSVYAGLQLDSLDEVFEVQENG